MRIEPSGLKRVVTCAPAFFQSPEDQKLCTKIGGNTAEPAEFSDDLCSTSSSSTSSIGRNSDLSSDGSAVDEDCGENEAQSSYNGPLDMMESLEEMLPIRRGISEFYNGKSKSFTSLAEASFSSSVKDITKPENAYTRRRRNLMAFNHVWDKNRSLPLRSNNGGISKRSISNSRSTLALAVAMNNCESSSTSEDSNSRSPPPLKFKRGGFVSGELHEMVTTRHTKPERAHRSHTGRTRQERSLRRQTYRFRRHRTMHVRQLSRRRPSREAGIYL